MKKFKQVIISNDSGERIELNDSPLGWDASKYNLIRDLRYFGVFKKISVEFEFVGDGYKFLQDHYLRYGVDADLIHRIYKRVNGGYKFLVDSKINMLNFDDDRKSRKFKCDLIQSSFVQKFQNREDVKLNVLNNISMDRNPINPVPTVPVIFRGKTIKFYSNFEGTYQVNGEKYHHIWPFLLKENGNPGVQEANAQQLDENTDELLIINNALYRNDLTETQTISIDWLIQWAGNKINLPLSVEVRHSMYLMNPDNSIDSTLFQESKVFNSLTPTIYNYVYNDTVSVDPGQYIIFICERLNASTHNPLNFADMDGIFLSSYVRYDSMSLTISQDSTYADSSRPVTFPHELLTNLIAQITGIDNAVYSEFFGRTDLGYAADGEGALLAITKGDLLRGVDISTTQISTSMRDAYTSYSAVFNLGILIRDNQIVIEPKDRLFNNNISANLGEVAELIITPTSEFLFNSVIAGYPNVEYEQQNGRDEFNTIVQYTNSLKVVKKELDLKSIYNGDGYGVEFARRLSIETTGSSDSRYDNMIFFIDLIRDGDGYKTRRLEGIDYVDGIFSPDTAMNLRIYTGQNLLRWGKYLNIPLHTKSDRSYFFQTKEKNSAIKLITPAGETNDREDINLGDAAYFLPEEKQFKSPITLDTLFSILENPLGIIRYTYKGESFFDYLFEVDAETDKSTGQWRMLSTKPSPVQVDTPDLLGDYIKYGDGSNDFVAHNNSVNDIVKYGDN